MSKHERPKMPEEQNGHSEEEQGKLMKELSGLFIQQIKNEPTQQLFTEDNLEKPETFATRLKLDAVARAIVDRAPSLKDIGFVLGVGTLSLPISVSFIDAFYGEMYRSHLRDVQSTRTPEIVEGDKSIQFQSEDDQGYYWHLRDFLKEHPEVISLKLHDITSSIGKPETGFGTVTREVMGDASIDFVLKSGKKITIHKTERTNAVELPQVEKTLKEISKRLGKAGIIFGNQDRDMLGTEFAQMSIEDDALHQCLTSYSMKNTIAKVTGK